MANTPPIAGTHHAMLGGIFSARISPVTTALKSKTVIGFLTISSNTASETTQLRTDEIITKRAFKPKCHTPKARVGTRAIHTSIIIFLVELLSLICGETETLYILFFPSLRFCLSGSYFSLCKLK